MFFEAQNGFRYPVADIARIGRFPSETGVKPDAMGRTPPVNVRLRDGEVVEVSEYVMEDVMRRSAQMIPALPDTFALRVWVDDEGVFVDRIPVLGWSVPMDDFVLPITPDGINDGSGSQSFLILTPDGRVTAPGLQWWDTLDDCLTDRKRDYEESKARRAVLDEQAVS